jgi:hypothetical protein
VLSGDDPFAFWRQCHLSRDEKPSQSIWAPALSGAFSVKAMVTPCLNRQTAQPDVHDSRNFAGRVIKRQMQSRLGPYGRARISVYQGL